MTIIFYDIISATGNAWSPNTWRVRFCLNYKRIPYKTEWVDYPDIAPLSKKFGIKPTGKTFWDGTDYYSLPAIHDPSTGIYLADSWAIAEYLENQYPSSPSIFPNNSRGLQSAFTDGFFAGVAPALDLLIPATYTYLTPKSQEYFRRTRELGLGKKVEDIAPKGEQAVEEWAKLKAHYDKVDTWFARTDDKGPFLMGDTISWADFVVAGWNARIRRVMGADSKEWRNIESWNGGRWSHLLVALSNYGDEA